MRRLSFLAFALGTLPTWIPVPASAQPLAFQTWQRPAFGVSLGGADHSDGTGDRWETDFAATFEVPVAMDGRISVETGRAWSIYEHSDPLYMREGVAFRRITVSVIKVLPPLLPFQVTPYFGFGIGQYRFTAKSGEHLKRRGDHLVAGLDDVVHNDRFVINGQVTVRYVNDSVLTIELATGFKVLF